MEPKKQKNNGPEIILLREQPELCQQAAAWFSGKWGIPAETYVESMRDMLSSRAAVPQWYVIAGQNQEIIAGAGVIENDFHNRKDLSPNVCALFVEKPCRRKGLARKLLNFIREDMGRLGVSPLYLVTEHDQFYEKCSWSFATMAMGDDRQPIRVYESPVFQSSAPSFLE